MGIYKITNKVNNKIYIGQSQDIITRIKGHKNTLKANTHFNLHLQRAYNKYGIDNFIYEIKEECNEDIINNREFYWINFYNSTDRFYGYNIDYGGNKDVMSEEHKLNMSIKRKGTYEIDVIDVEISYSEFSEILKQKSKNEKLLLYAMLINSKRYSDNNDIFYMSYKSMMTAIGISIKTAIRIVNKLKDDNIIDIISRNTIQTNSYKINLNNPLNDNDKIFIIDKKDNNHIKSFTQCLFEWFIKKDVRELLPRSQYEYFNHII